MTTASYNPRSETFFERHAWKVWLAMSGIIVLFGIGDMLLGGSTLASGEHVMMEGITGVTWEELSAASPRTANLIDMFVRQGGVNLFAIGLLTAAVTLTGFRRGERWAWYTLCVWPAWASLVFIVLLRTPKMPGSGTPVPMISGPIFLVVSALTLTFSYRKFFPKR